MAYTSIQTSLVSGEVSPSLFGRVDLAKWRSGASTLRNFFVNYRGGVSSRPGTAYVGMCKQGAPNVGGTSTANPPRDIPFQFNINQGYILEFGDQYMRVKYRGSYVVEPTKDISGATVAALITLTIASHGYSVGDWVYVSSMGGMPNLNGKVWVVNAVPNGNTVQLTDLFGVAVSSAGWSAYTSGGTSARIYTVASPYAAVDLPYLKFTQSADTMSLVCLNTVTSTEYPPYNLTRQSNSSWVFAMENYTSGISPPASVGATSQASTTLTTWYSYQVTAVSSSTGDESIASNVAQVENNDISVYAGSNVINWTAISGAEYYNVYKTTPIYGRGAPVGAIYGYLGTSYGTELADTNITADFSRVPPRHKDPFARGAISFVTPVVTGSGYVQGSTVATITTSTGSGATILPVVVAGEVTSFTVEQAGSNYRSTDTVVITDSGGGTGATASLIVGPLTGTYPSVVGYFQQRRVYAASLNRPNTYWMSRPGSFANMDSAIPTTDGDSITGAPWAEQLDGIQWLVPMPGGLVVLTGKGAWQVNGGSNNAAITPSSQTATPQSYNGANNIVPPITINYDILYVQAKGSIVRDLSYNFYVNIYTGTDMTVLSNHLFDNNTIVSWAWSEEPNKIVWCIRNDGIMLSFTFLKEQDVYAWARHDTIGLYQCACSVAEPPVDAVYFIVKRYIRGNWVYYAERQDNRNWPNSESCWCVDAGLQYPQLTPNAQLTIGAVTGSTIFTASAAVFSNTAGNGAVGDVVRVGGGTAVVTAYNSPTSISVTFTGDVTETLPNGFPVPYQSGAWSIAAPTLSVSGLDHLEGQIVSILADGAVITPQTVTNGSIYLDQPASKIIAGLPFIAQAQTLYLEPQGQPETSQSRRKKIGSVGLGLEATRGIKVGVNQPDASTQPNGATPEWSGLVEIKQRNATVNAGDPIPLETGYVHQNLPQDWDYRGQVAIQQEYPLPATILSVVTYYQVGDSPG